MTTTNDDYTERHLALAEALELDPNDITEGYDDEHFDVNGGEYWVLTDDEANEAWNESLDNYLDEYVYPELPENLRGYFDDDAWKRDARMDGRGHCLSGYDGSEIETEYDGESYAIFRTN